jgi:DNA polymerase elongation subunit (family B)
MPTYQIDKILFLDIETVPQTAALTDMSYELQKLWAEKFEAQRRRMPDRYPEDIDAAAAYSQEAGIYAEFGKIVCISVGLVFFRKGEKFIRLKSFAGDDEKTLLLDFATLIQKTFTPDHNICGHNIKEFDIPYIARRMLINGVALPPVLDIAGKKPWEVKFIDTLEMWRFGDYKNYTALKLLTAVFGIPTPKDDIDGSQVASVYYEENNLNRIATYCEKDVLATAQLFHRFNGLPLIEEGNVEIAIRKG